MTPFWFYTKCLICIASSVWLFLWLYGKVHITILSFDKICCQRFLVQLLCKLAHQQFLLSALFEKNINIEEYCAEYNCYITVVWTYSYSKNPTNIQNKKILLHIARYLTFEGAWVFKSSVEIFAIRK